MKLIYVRDENKRPIGAVAYEADGYTVTYGVAICSPKDKWNRQRARTIAERRFQHVGLRRNSRPWTYGQTTFLGVKDLLLWIAEKGEAPRSFAHACATTAQALRP